MSVCKKLTQYTIRPRSGNLLIRSNGSLCLAKDAAEIIDALEAEKEGLRAAIAKHRDNFPDEALEGERELWSSLDSKP